MATIKRRLYRKNSSGSYDTVHFETSAGLVLRSNGDDVDTALTTIENTFSNYALSSHTHSSYVTSSTVQSMINAGASSIYYSGNVRSTTVVTGSTYDVAITFNITTSATVCIAATVSHDMLFIKDSSAIWHTSLGSSYHFSYTSTTLYITGNSGLIASAGTTVLYVLM